MRPVSLFERLAGQEGWDAVRSERPWSWVAEARCGKARMTANEIEEAVRGTCTVRALGGHWISCGASSWNTHTKPAAEKALPSGRTGLMSRLHTQRRREVGQAQMSGDARCTTSWREAESARTRRRCEARAANLRRKPRSKVGDAVGGGAGTIEVMTHGGSRPKENR